MGSHNREHYLSMVRYFRASELERIMLQAYQEKLVPKSYSKGTKRQLLVKVRDLLKGELSFSIEQTILKIQSERNNDSGKNRCMSNCGDQSRSSYDKNLSVYDDRDRFDKRKSSTIPCVFWTIPRNHQDMPSGQLSSCLNRQYPQRPDVKFRELPFYEIVNPLIVPTCIADAQTDRSRKMEFHFTLTNQHLKQLLETSELSLQLRVCRLDCNSEQDDEVPDALYLEVNNASLYPEVKTRKKNKCLKKAIDVTPILKKTSFSVHNVIQASWRGNFNKPYVITLNLVKKVSSAYLIEKLMKNICSPNVTSTIVKEKLNYDQDVEITSSSLRSSLICPLSRSKMKLPCRASTCTHIQCFEAEYYIRMNEINEKWLCPICNKFAYFKDLVIDGLFLNILSKVQESCCEVQFHKDGSWATFEPPSKNLKLNSPSSSVVPEIEEPEIIELEEPEIIKLEEPEIMPQSDIIITSYFSISDF